jgi:large-conductance mechanosensitive channel
MVMVLLSEFVTYLIKFIALGLIAFAGIMCGANAAKKKKAAAEAAANEAANADESAE